MAFGKKSVPVSHDKEEIQQTIDSLRGRIAGMSRAIAGLEHSLTM